MKSNNCIFSTLIRAGRTTFFVDLREAKDGALYLSISENRLDREERKTRSMVRVFGADMIRVFRQAVEEATASIPEEVKR